MKMHTRTFFGSLGFGLLGLCLPTLACDPDVGGRPPEDALAHLEAADTSEERIDPNLSEAGLCSHDPDSVEAGDENPFFVAVARDVVEFQPDAAFTIDEDASVVHMKAGSGTGSIKCRCDGGCSGACIAKIGPNEATCDGSCDGLSDDGKPCGGCSFHYELPDTTFDPSSVDPSEPEPDPTVPVFPRALPAKPWW